MKKLIILCLSLSSLVCFNALPDWNNPGRMKALLVELKEAHVEWDRCCDSMDEREMMISVVGGIKEVYAYVKAYDVDVPQETENGYACYIRILITGFKNS